MDSIGDYRTILPRIMPWNFFTTVDGQASFEAKTRW